MRLHTWTIATLLAVSASAVVATSFQASLHAQKAPAVDAARIAGAKELMAAAGVSKQFDAVMPLLFEQMQKLFVQQHATRQNEVKEIFGAVQARMSARKQDLIDEIAVLYAQKLTAEELRELTRFYTTGVGAKFIQIQPEIAGQSAAIGQRWGQKLGAEVEQEVRREAKKRGMDL